MHIKVSDSNVQPQQNYAIRMLQPELHVVSCHSAQELDFKKNTPYWSLFFVLNHLSTP